MKLDAKPVESLVGGADEHLLSRLEAAIATDLSELRTRAQAVTGFEANSPFSIESGAAATDGASESYIEEDDPQAEARMAVARRSIQALLAAEAARPRDAYASAFTTVSRPPAVAAAEFDVLVDVELVAGSTGGIADDYDLFVPDACASPERVESLVPASAADEAAIGAGRAAPSPTKKPRAASKPAPTVAKITGKVKPPAKASSQKNVTSKRGAKTKPRSARKPAAKRAGRA